MRESGPILLTGAAGFLGHAVGRALVAGGRRALGTSRDGEGLPGGVEPAPLSLDDGGEAAAALVLRVRPAAVLHLAAMASPDACARDPAGAWRVNAQATGRVARAASDVGAYLVYTSTDLVFDGRRAPYAEEDPPAPLGPYMASKAAGEELVLATAPAACVARVALLYGRRAGRRGCFTDQLIERLERGEALRLFTDQTRTPLHVDDAAGALAELLERRPAGRLHLAGPARVTRHAFGLAVARALGLDERLCLPGEVDDEPGLAPRPADVSLRIDRLVRLLGRAPRGVEEGCAALRR